MLKSLEIILHPPELKGKDRRRYWLAVVGWFGLMLAMIILLPGSFGLLFYVLGIALENLFGGDVLRPYEDIAILFGMGITGVIAIILSDRLWSRVFIQSGYLSDAAAIRILSNRAPTQTSERRHRWVGQVILLLVYGGIGVAAVVAKQWWVLIIVIPLGVWGVFLIRNAWKETDVMLKGGAIPPASEERIRYIEKVLDDRSQNK